MHVGKHGSSSWLLQAMSCGCHSYRPHPPPRVTYTHSYFSSPRASPLFCLVVAFLTGPRPIAQLSFLFAKGAVN